jgi:hypothetical protein
MKKIVFLIVLGVSIAQISSAKKVKFVVDMTGQVIAPLGIHVTGNFQEAAGYEGGDFTSNSTEMLKEGDTNIYSVVVDVPAPAMYEYTFINGDQWYEAEFVPMESRIGYDDNAYRWIYIDNTAPSEIATTDAILFSGNAPKDKFLVRLLLDMTNETVSSNGVYIAGNYQNWNLAETPMYNFVDNSYEAIVFMPAGNNEYKFFNGNELTNAETVPSTCATNGNRSINVLADTVLAKVAFSACDPGNTALKYTHLNSGVTLYPTVCEAFSTLSFPESDVNYTVTISDFSGRIIKKLDNISDNSLIISKDNLSAGIYFVRTSAGFKLVSVNKLIIK